MDTAFINAVAAEHGLALPRFITAASNPPLWRAWADRVLAVDSAVSRGRDIAPAVAEANRYAV